MEQTANYLPYDSTGYFTKIVSDYLSCSPQLRPFYQHRPDMAGLKASIEARQSFETPRTLLVEVLEEQYKELPISEKVSANIQLLKKESTFTITTAHQPNIFTGPLYFIYKILHAVKLAAELASEFPEFHFVPVYYMGSEDADLDELGFVEVGGQKLTWETQQTGAVGRMKVDKVLIKLIHAIHGQAGVLPFGKEWTDLLFSTYTEGKTIQQATLELVNQMFADYGLVILIPDNGKLKTAFQSVITKELTEQFSHAIVAETIAALGKTYKVQTGGRELNLFYLKDDKRERIEVSKDVYTVLGTDLSFTQQEILQELADYPDRFSGNVILRGAFQETVLPNISFIGGGGELAYWLELKNVFAAVQIPYPVLMLRNSFLLVSQEQANKWQQLGFTETEWFSSELDLVNSWVKRNSENPISLSTEIEQAAAFYNHLKTLTNRVDKTLSEHVSALEKKALKKITDLEKKLLRAEKKRYEVQQNQIHVLQQALFPHNSLQERVDNISLYYARFGKEWLQMIYEVSTGLNKGFGYIVYKDK